MQLNDLVRHSVVIQSFGLYADWRVCLCLSLLWLFTLVLHCCMFALMRASAHIFVHSFCGVFVCGRVNMSVERLLPFVNCVRANKEAINYDAKLTLKLLYKRQKGIHTHTHTRWNVDECLPQICSNSWQISCQDQNINNNNKSWETL